MALLLAPAAGRTAAETPARSTPTRPGPASAAAAVATPPPPPVKRIGRTDYVGVADMAQLLGLKVAVTSQGRKAVLSAQAVRAELETDTRDITVNGVRVFLGDPVATSGGQLHVSRIDFERCLVPMLRPGYGVAPRAAPQVIMLDAGHGGTDPGKVNGRLGLTEKILTLDVARRVKKLLEAAGHRVVLTREDDSYIAPLQRAALANIAKADAFVSIHFNALPNDTRTSGVEVYTFAPRLQRSTNAWGLSERNDTEEAAAPGNRFDHWNVALAHAVHRRFVGDLRVADRGKKLMHLAVLRPLDCPGILLECGFLTSESEARKIATPAYRQQIAAALAAGIRDYAATLEGLRPRVPAPATVPAAPGLNSGR